MAFIDELTKRLGEVVKKVGEKSEELVEIGKINYEIFKEEDAIKRLYREIGQSVYEAYKQENNSLEAICRLCQEIDDRKKKVELLKKQAEDIKKDAQGREGQGKEQTQGQRASAAGEQEDAQTEAAQGTDQDDSQEAHQGNSDI